MSVETPFAKKKNKSIVVNKKIITRITEKIEIITIEQPEDQITQSLEFENNNFHNSGSLKDIESFDALLIDDSDYRREFASVLGLPDIQEKSDEAFDEIFGLLDDFIEAEEDVDTVNWTKELRRMV